MARRVRTDVPAKTSGTAIEPIAPATAIRLRRYNLVMGVLHLAQGVAVLVLANSFAIPVVATFLDQQPGSAPDSLTTLFDFRFAWGVAAFLFISAIAHFLISAPGVFPRYERMLRAGRNDYRWIEYSLSASLMAVLIALLPGITDIAAVIAIFGANAAMIFFGLLQERYERPGGSLLPFWLGSLVGIIPWLAIGVYLSGAGTDNTPTADISSPTCAALPPKRCTRYSGSAGSRK